MDIDGSYFFSDELEEAPLAYAAASPHLRDRSPDEGDLLEGETLSEDALRAIRTWFGF
jgi:hypothetical protein